MRPDPAAILEAWESDWALGELLHLISEAKRYGQMPHERDRELFTACMRVIGSEPFEVRLQMHRIIMATEYWRGFYYFRHKGKLYRGRSAYA